MWTHLRRVLRGNSTAEDEQRNLLERAVQDAFDPLDLVRLQRLRQQVTRTQGKKPRADTACAALAHWQPQADAVELYATILARAEMGREARHAVRWLAAMHGPQRPIFATVRATANALHAPMALLRPAGHHPGAHQAVLAQLEATYDRRHVTLTVGHPWRADDDVWMTFHGRTPGGFRAAARLMVEACDAALLGAWLADGRRVGQHVDALLGRLVQPCANGTTDEALAVLAEADAAVDAVANVAPLWCQLDAMGFVQRLEADQSRPRAEHELLCKILSEHVRAFHAAAWRQFARANGCAADRLTPQLEAILDVAPSWPTDYFNPARLTSALHQQGARVVQLGNEEYARLIELQVHEYLTLPGTGAAEALPAATRREATATTLRQSPTP